jgi:GxxExxY protein
VGFLSSVRWRCRCSKGVRLDCGYGIDLIVEGTVVVELKSVDVVHPIEEAPLLTYLRLSGKRVGLMINFNVAVLKAGVIRRVL